MVCTLVGKWLEYCTVEKSQIEDVLFEMEQGALNKVELYVIDFVSLLLP